MKNVDTLTIGAGGGAYPAAFRLARTGRQVVMIDSKGIMSGNCLAEGCVPSKAIREVSGMVHTSRKGSTFGFKADLTVDYAGIVAHKDSVQKLRYAQHDQELQAISERLSVVKGVARFVDPHVVDVEGESGTDRYHADHIVLASGSDIIIPHIPGTDLCWTSRDLYALHPNVTTLPRTLVVVGGGYIGLETASFYTNLGVKVTVAEMTNQLLPGMDPDFVSLLAPMLDPKIGVELGAAVQRIERNQNNFRVIYQQDNVERQIDAEAVLMAVGRAPVLPAGTAEIGIKIEHGRPLVNSAIQTNYPHIYAAGDVNGRSMLFHSAVRQSLVAAENILHQDQAVDYMDWNSVPTTIFTFPEAAYVGLTRHSAKAHEIDVLEASYDFSEDTRAQILDETRGELRLFFEAGSMRLLGGWIVGVDAGNLVGEIGIAVANGLTAYDLARFPDQHPMASEGIGKAARRLVA